MMKEYKKPEISVMTADNNDIIKTSDEGNPLMSGSFNMVMSVVGSTVFNDEWINSSFSDQ